MVEHDSSKIRAVAWSEVLPWLSIVRVFRLAISLRALLLGAVGILIMTTGWAVIARIFPPESQATAWLQPVAECPWKSVTETVPDRPAGMVSRLFVESHEAAAPQERGWEPKEPMLSSWKWLSAPAWAAMVYANVPLRDAASLLLCGLVGVAVWAFFGTAICRIAAVQLAADEPVGWGAALRFAGRKWPACCAAPLLPIGGVVLAAVPILVLGWIMRADVGLLLGGLLWPLALVAGLLMTLLLLGLLFGWPLMWGTISAEGTDSFDALSRSYAYVFQRPLHYLFYVVVAGVIGWLGWLLVQNFAASVVWLTYWSAGWGSDGERLQSILGIGEELSGAAAWGVVLIHFFAGCVKLLAVGYLYSYFWTAATAIYFLLRRDVDATEMDEVFLDADASEPPAEAPDVPTEQAGQADAPAAEA